MNRVFLLLISGAFLVLTLLIAALAANGIYQLNRLNNQVNQVIKLYSLKLDTVGTLHLNAFARGDRLLRMAIEEDPFARTEIFIEFNRAGFLVGSGRQKLLELGLSPEEKKLFDEQSQLIARIVPMQERVVDALDRDQITTARNILIAEGIAMQSRLIDMLGELHDQMRTTHDHAIRTADENYRRGLFLTYALGVSATLFGLGLALFTMNRLSRNARDIDLQMKELKASRAALEAEATHDAMTGLANRKLFYDRLRQAMLHAKRYNRMVGVLFVDMDNFKTVNDLYGHHVGDALLEEVARRLQSTVRGSDTVARAGGDEFLILLGNLSRPEDCDTAIDKIEDALECKATLHGVELMISASIGHALYPKDGVSEDALIRAADASMYQAKAGQSRNP